MKHLFFGMITILSVLIISVSFTKEENGWRKIFYNDEESRTASQQLAAVNDKNGEDDQSNQAQQPTETTKNLHKQPVNSKNKQTMLQKENKNQIPKSSDRINNTPELLPEEMKSKENTELNNKSHKDQTANSNQNKLDGYHIVLDPGHGGKDSGASAADINEKKLTLAIAKRIADQLEHNGAEVTLTRKNDSYVSLEDRVHISNSKDTDAFISLHMNQFQDSNVNGVSTYYQTGNENKKLAESLQSASVDKLDVKNRGVKQENYQVLRDNKRVAALIELGFISNPEERKQAHSKSYQNKTVKVFVTALKHYFNKT